MSFVLVLAFAFSERSTEAYSLNGHRWPDGSQVMMHLGLSHSPNSFQDGSGSWNGSAGDALAIWNQYINKVQFVQAGAVSNSGGDGNNSAFFSKTVYGKAFGSHVLAITLSFSGSGPVFTETDVIFNDNQKWSSYRGPLQYSGNSYTYDFHRVALHEFGHVLGLDHPDENGQSIDAIMNSIISDRDALSDDDIAGARFLYGQRILSNLAPPALSLGQAFNYQIVADNNPSNFSAAGLPPGLQINPATGIISGSPVKSGSYDVMVFAYGPSGTASATLKITVAAPSITSGRYSSALLGSSYQYRIMADNQPASFDASGLPAGLSLDRLSGIISGVPSLTGSTIVTLIAHGPYEDASATISLQVFVPPPTAAPTVNQFNLEGSQLLADPVRPRIYCATSTGISVIDTNTRAVVNTISTSGTITDMSISPDGRTLWMIRSQTALRRLDLDSLQTLPDMAVPENVTSVREGLEHRLYVTTVGTALLQLDAITGAVQQRITPAVASANYFSSCLGLSADGKTLYLGAMTQVGSFYNSTTAQICRFDVTSSTPGLVERANVPGINVRYILSNPAREAVIVVPGTNDGEGNSATHSTFVFPAMNLNGERRSFDFQGTAGAAALSADGAYLYQIVALSTGASIEIFNTTNFQRVKSIGLGYRSGGGAFTGLVAVDPAASYVYAYFYPPNYYTGLIGSFDATLPAPVAVPPRRLLNVSTRLRSQTGDNVLIGGFIITGTGSKRITVRALGPSLPLADKLGDPVLELHGAAGGLLATSDNWNEHRQDVLASGLSPGDEHESVIVATLPPGPYTAILRGISGSIGVALVEVFDSDPTSESRIGNISTRGKVETGDNVMIGGFIIGGDQPTRVIVRALGPSLANYGVSGPLLDPTVTLYNTSGMATASNDDWQDEQAQEIIDANQAPADPREAVFIRTLSPGAYTAIVSGKGGTSGVALVEVFNLETN